jgi:hypothetical protein
MSPMEFDTFEKFWRHYLREHGRPETRELHVLGTSVAVVLVVASIASAVTKRELRSPKPSNLLAAAVLAGYGPAWIGHFFFEKNRPATFEHPAWSFLADLRMTWLWLTGSLNRELEIAGVGSRRLASSEGAR